MTEQRMNEVQARLDAATPGPWSADDGSHGPFIAACGRQGSWWQVVGQGGRGEYREYDDRRAKADAHFIAAARTDLRDALAALRRVRDLLASPDIILMGAYGGVGDEKCVLVERLRKALDGSEREADAER
jgi:hypothetical protein